MFIDLREQLVPSADQAALVGVSHELEFVLGPALLDASKELVKDELTACLVQDICDNFIVFDEVSLPQIVEDEVVELDLNPQLGQELLPVACFHGLALQLQVKPIDFSVLLKECLVLIVYVVCSELVREVVHHLEEVVECLLDFLVDVGGERNLVDLIDVDPHLVNFGPHVLQQLVILDNGLQAQRIAQLHVEQLLSFADSAPLLVGLGDLRSNDIQLVKCVLGSELGRSGPVLFPFVLDHFDSHVAFFFFLDNLLL